MTPTNEQIERIQEAIRRAKRLSRTISPHNMIAVANEIAEAEALEALLASHAALQAKLEAAEDEICELKRQLPPVVGDGAL